MTVRRRTLLIVGCAMLALLVGQYAGLRYAFVRALTELEDDRVRQQVDQAIGEIRKEISNIDSVAADYAAWDKTYAYVVRPTPEFPQSDLADEALRRLRLDAVAIVNTSGQDVLFRSLLIGPDLANIRTALFTRLAPGTPLVTFSNADASHQGLIEIDGIAFAIAIRPVLTSEGTGPGRGALLMARRFDDAEIRRIGETIHLSLALKRRPSSGAGTVTAGTGDPGIQIDVLSPDRIAGELPVADIRDIPRWTLRVDSDRPLHVQGERWFVYFILAFVVSVVGVAALTLALLDRIVLRRLSSISRTVTTIAQTGDLTTAVNAGGRDELAAVGSAIDYMLERIRESRAAAERSANEAARLKSEFLANMSHEIRTPLNGVLGTLKILEDTSLSADQEDLVRTSLGCAEGLLGLLNDVLDLSKIEAGKLTFVDEAVDLRTIAEEALVLFGPLVGSKPIDLLMRADPRVPSRVMGDEGRLRQVLVNLVGNAVKFTDAGHVLIALSLDEGVSPPTIGMSVTDTGVGIAPDKLTAIFESFTQADAATTRRYGGTGLGLTITQKLLALMGGTIGVTSQPDRGSTFTCRFPLRAAPAAPDSALWTGQVVVLDVPGVRRSVTAETLRGLGASVVEAAPTALEVVPSRDAVFVVFASSRKTDQQLETALRGHRLLMVLHGRKSVAQSQSAAATLLVQPVTRDQWRRALSGAATIMPLAPTPSIKRLAGRILLAEDNRVNQVVAVGLLKKLGCSVDTAENGAEAVRLFETGSYDVILMDCEMPEMDGYEATRRIRAGLREIKTPIIALTAHAMSDARDQCLEAGMNDFIAKPLQLETLQSVLEKYLVCESA